MEHQGQAAEGHHFIEQIKAEQVTRIAQPLQAGKGEQVKDRVAGLPLIMGKVLKAEKAGQKKDQGKQHRKALAQQIAAQKKVKIPQADQPQAAAAAEGGQQTADQFQYQHKAHALMQVFLVCSHKGQAEADQGRQQDGYQKIPGIHAPLLYKSAKP